MEQIYILLTWQFKHGKNEIKSLHKYPFVYPANWETWIKSRVKEFPERTLLRVESLYLSED